MPAWWRRYVPPLIVLFVIGLTGGGSIWSIQAPSPLSGNGPEVEFSAYRAKEHIARIASRPHPTGSAAATRARDYLVDQLRELGMRVRPGTSVVSRTSRNGTHLAGTVANVNGVLRGRDSTGRVLLVAHYDSVPTGPGAADNASNVAAVLEVVRALLAGGQPRNDIEVLFTDGEEAGLLGARAYLERRTAGRQRRTAVLNLEARGTGGSVIMFQTAGGSSRLTRSLAASGAVSTSVSDAVYRSLPNDTDLTEFADAGYAGMNFAYVAGSAHYHTAHDDLEHLDLGSVQQMGEVVLSAADHLASVNLSRELAGDGDDTYFTVLGWLVRYPASATVPLALLAVVGFAALLWWARRYGVRAGRVGLAAVTFPVPLVVSVLIGVGVWWLLSSLRPDYQLFRAGDPYRPGWYAAGEVCLVVVALLLWYRWMRRRCASDEVGLAVLGWFAGCGLLTAWLLPGGGYLFTWPALFGCAGTAFALRRCSPESLWRPLPGAAAATLVAVLLLTPVAVLLFPTLGLARSAVPLLLLTLLAGAGLGFTDLVRPRSLTYGMLAVAVAAPVLVAGGLVLDQPDSRNPRPGSLGYAVDADTGKALWLAWPGDPDDDLDDRLSAGPSRVGDRFPNLVGWRTGDAGRDQSVPAPILRRLDEQRRGDVRTVRVRLRAAAETYRLGVYADTSHHRVLGASVAGRRLPGGAERDVVPGDGSRWRWGVEYVGALADGVVIEFRVRGKGRLPVRVVAMSVGLPPEASRPGEPGSPMAYPAASGQVFVSRGFTV